MPANLQSQSEPKGVRRASRGLLLRAGRTALRSPRHVGIAAIRVYQLTAAPLLPLIFGPGCGCRFHPTCSHYAVEALQRHGFFAGVWLAARRLLRCQPFHPGGLDPVPETFHFLGHRTAVSPLLSARPRRRVTQVHG